MAPGTPIVAIRGLGTGHGSVSTMAGTILVQAAEDSDPAMIGGIGRDLYRKACLPKGGAEGRVEARMEARLGRVGTVPRGGFRILVLIRLRFANRPDRPVRPGCRVRRPGAPPGTTDRARWMNFHKIIIICGSN